MSSRGLTRREVLGAAVGTAIAAATPAAGQDTPPERKGRFHKSVCKWCYPNISLEDLCTHAKTMGIESVELLGEHEWPVVKQHGLTCAMANGPSGIVDGWNRTEDHDKLVKESERLLPLVKDAGLPNMIVFSGNRRGISDDDGLANCANGLKRIMPLAESLGINVCMELLNSKVDHHDYQCDHTLWGVELVKRVESPRFKLLYDIYHMQIMEGDVVATIQKNRESIAHFHTGGVPGRHEIDDTQELNYRRVSQALVDIGFTGFMAHEFIPRRDPMTSLRQAVQICTV